MGTWNGCSAGSGTTDDDNEGYRRLARATGIELMPACSEVEVLRTLIFVS